MLSSRWPLLVSHDNEAPRRNSSPSLVASRATVSSVTPIASVDRPAHAVETSTEASPPMPASTHHFRFPDSRRPSVRVASFTPSLRRKYRCLPRSVGLAPELGGERLKHGTRRP